MGNGLTGGWHGPWAELGLGKEKEIRWKERWVGLNEERKEMKGIELGDKIHIQKQLVIIITC